MNTTVRLALQHVAADGHLSGYPIFSVDFGRRLTIVENSRETIAVLAMANKNLHAQLKERVEEYNLSQEEVAAIDKARAQLSSHSKISRRLLNTHSSHVNMPSRSNLWWIRWRWSWRILG